MESRSQDAGAVGYIHISHAGTSRGASGRVLADTPHRYSRGVQRLATRTSTVPEGHAIDSF